MLGYAAAAQVMMTILPLYLQDAFVLSPAIAGLAMTPFALPLLIGPSVGGRLATHMSSRAILSFGLGLVALGNAVAAAAVLADLAYWTAAIGMLITGSGAGLLNSETAKAQVSSVPPERAGMASGLASTTRFIGIIAGVVGLGAVLAGVAEASLRRLGAPLVLDQRVDWHDLSLRIVGGDASGALSALSDPIRIALQGTVHASVAAGFGAALSVAAVVAVLQAWRVGGSSGRLERAHPRAGHAAYVCHRPAGTALHAASSWVAGSMCRSSGRSGYGDKRQFDCLTCLRQAADAPSA
jgi:MFS family permease